MSAPVPPSPRARLRWRESRFLMFHVKQPKAETPSSRTGFRSGRALLRQLLDNFAQSLVDNLLLRGDPGGEVPGSSGFSAVSEQAQNRRAERSRRAVSVFFMVSVLLFDPVSLFRGLVGRGSGVRGVFRVSLYRISREKTIKIRGLAGGFSGIFPQRRRKDAKNGGRVGPPPLC